MKTYQHILVPLDSSNLAELALDDAFALAQLSQAKITLLHVIPPFESVLAVETGHPVYIDQQWDQHKTMAIEYLQGVCSRLSCPEIAIETVVETGLAAETIIEYATTKAVDMIVMATHGRSGIQRWVFGSVADKVLRGADVPVLLTRAYTGDRVLTDVSESGATP
jgi:nucleotide-binding universal stress UspA family protein